MRIGRLFFTLLGFVGFAITGRHLMTPGVWVLNQSPGVGPALGGLMCLVVAHLLLPALPEEK